MTIPQWLFEAAASALTDPSTRARADPAVLCLLGTLDCPLPAVPGIAEERRALLLRAAAGFARVFRLSSEAAPGLNFFGAEAAPDAIAAERGLPIVGVAGSGDSVLEAFEACIAEGIERLSMVETEADRSARQSAPLEVAGWLQPLLCAEEAHCNWLTARRIGDGAAVLVPADLCLHRAHGQRAFDPHRPLSIGCAAGATAESATLAAILELIERDAVALWWRGGQRGRPVALEERTMSEAAASLARLRRGRRTRRTWLLDITTDLGIPVVAAVSFAPDGHGFCLGTAARPDMPQAAGAALKEMAQGELAIEVIEARRRRGGERALTSIDERQLRRFSGIHAGRCVLVHPAAPARSTLDLPNNGPAEALRGVLDRLGSHGLDGLTLDLTRPRFGVPVVRVFCPGLECEPSRLIGPRLAKAMAAGGGNCHADGINLM